MLAAIYEPSPPITDVQDLQPMLDMLGFIRKIGDKPKEGSLGPGMLYRSKLNRAYDFFLKAYARKYGEPLVLIHVDDADVLIFRHQHVPVDSPPTYVIFFDSAWERTSLLFLVLIMFGTPQTVRIFLKCFKPDLDSSRHEPFLGELDFYKFQAKFIPWAIPKGIVNSEPDKNMQVAKFRKNVLQLLTLRNRGIRIEFTTISHEDFNFPPQLFLQIWDMRVYPPVPLFGENDLKLLHLVEDWQEPKPRDVNLHPMERFYAETVLQDWPLYPKMYEFGFLEEELEEPYEDPYEGEIEGEIEEKPQEIDELDEMLGMPFYDETDFAEDEEELDEINEDENDEDENDEEKDDADDDGEKE
jgi:hypothetical protein